MRIAAGILLMIGGGESVAYFVSYVVLLITYSGPMDENPFMFFLFIIFGAFLITGGVLCFKRKHWRVCFASALTAFLVSIAILLMRGWYYMQWNEWLLSMSLIPTVILISLTKNEWKEISDSVDGKVSYGG